MKHSEVLTLKNKLSTVTGLTGFTTKISIRRNIAKLEKCIKPLAEEEADISQIVKDYRSEFSDIDKRLSDGKVKVEIVQGRRVEEFDVPELKKEQQKKERDELAIKYKDAIEKYEIKIRAFQEYLEKTESEFKPIVIPMSQIEEYDKEISQENLDAIWPLILDDTAPAEDEEVAGAEIQEKAAEINA